MPSKTSREDPGLRAKERPRTSRGPNSIPSDLLFAQRQGRGSDPARVVSDPRKD